MKRNLLLLLLLLIPITTHAQRLASYGVRVDSISASATCGTGTAFAIPTASATRITWAVVYSAGPATTPSILLETSLDNVNWFTSDTSTEVSGGIRSFVTSALFVRGKCDVKTDGGNLTVSMVLNRE